jgi:hypothetical protein
LAFDEHISPLIRRVLTYFPGDQNFDGISFSTTVHGRTKPGVPAAKPLSVEFFFPLESLRRYDCAYPTIAPASNSSMTELCSSTEKRVPGSIWNFRSPGLKR